MVCKCNKGKICERNKGSKKPRRAQQCASSGDSNKYLVRQYREYYSIVIDYDSVVACINSGGYGAWCTARLGGAADRSPCLLVSPHDVSFVCCWSELTAICSRRAHALIKISLPPQHTYPTHTSATLCPEVLPPPLRASLSLETLLIILVARLESRALRASNRASWPTSSFGASTFDRKLSMVGAATPLYVLSLSSLYSRCACLCRSFLLSSYMGGDFHAKMKIGVSTALPGTVWKLVRARLPPCFNSSPPPVLLCPTGDC